MQPSISSITNGPRQSNIEILRIISMFLVLVVHADFWALGHPGINDFESAPARSFTMTFFESVSIVCVNVFILISGWFCIKASLKGFCNFIFQCIYFLFGIYAVMLIFGLADFSFKGLAGCLCLTQANWFIRAYIALYLLSPVLNAFIEKCSKKQYEAILVSFFIFQTIYGWSGAAKFIEIGYSCFSFIGLYLLARYIRIYCGKLLKWGGYCYIFTVMLNIILYYATTIMKMPIDYFAYVNPLVIIGAAGLLMFFANLQIKHNRIINWVAKSSFAVFLLHSNPNIGEQYYKTLIQDIFQNFSGMTCILVIFLALVCIFVLAIILDQPRKFLWKTITKSNFK